MKSDDLTSLFTQGERQQSDLNYHQGVVASWNVDTGENVVDVLGSRFTNLPLMDSSDIVTIRPGAVVGLLRFKTTYFILGALVNPGPTVIETRSAIGFNTGITASAFNQSQAAGTNSGYVVDGNGVTFTTYSGRWLILLTAQVDLSGPRSAARFSYTAGSGTPASDDRAAMVLDPGGTSGILQTVCYSNTHDEGGPAQVTVNPAFKLTAGPTFATAAIWTNRSVIVHSF